MNKNPISQLVLALGRNYHNVEKTYCSYRINTARLDSFSFSIRESRHIVDSEQKRKNKKRGVLAPFIVTEKLSRALKYVRVEKFENAVDAAPYCPQIPQLLRKDKLLE